METDVSNIGNSADSNLNGMFLIANDLVALCRWIRIAQSVKDVFI